MLAMHNMNLAKLTVDDLPLFLGITKDLFPSITLPVVKNDVLISAIKRCMIKNNHQPSESAIAKIVQLYETKVSRHSVMVLGSTGTTKTTTWKTLRDAMALLKSEKVNTFETAIVSEQLFRFNKTRRPVHDISSMDIKIIFLIQMYSPPCYRTS